MRNHGDPIEYICSVIDERGGEDEHMPLMLHDWCAWKCTDDKQLTHVVRSADKARQMGYELVTHIDCLHDESLWK